MPEQAAFAKDVDTLRIEMVRSARTQAGGDSMLYLVTSIDVNGLRVAVVKPDDEADERAEFLIGLPQVVGVIVEPIEVPEEAAA